MNSSQVLFSQNISPTKTKIRAYTVYVSIGYSTGCICMFTIPYVSIGYRTGCICIGTHTHKYVHTYVHARVFGEGRGILDGAHNSNMWDTHVHTYV